MEKETLDEGSVLILMDFSENLNFVAQDEVGITTATGRPGPAAVMLPSTVGYEGHDPTKYRAPNYTMRPKPPLVDRRVRPAPNRYTIEKYYTRVGKDGTPQYTARWPLEPLSMPKSPGPMAYRVEDVPVLKTNRAPHYSLNDRHKQRSLTQPPAPNTYTLPVVIGENVIYKPNAPSYSLSGYPRFWIYRPWPGPADYTVGEVNLIRPKAPAYTMPDKVYPPPGGPETPGPAKYLPPPIRCCQTNDFGISFGIKHSPYLTPLILPCDN
ncbi:outer dense fiber protein 3-like [Schistocerca nitens]|uniref:outer dense fiber protein 3-like n=1 Tax=Schistocerca nitens TaxID=7011 RepID=UPI00211847C7|nr:outer dense fiber protein 3-like [Schistocerca nitens]